MVSAVNKTYGKSIFRTIKSSLSRFLAILAIVALGVGFLAGLLSSPGDMRVSADHYYDESRMYDARVLSTLGLTEDDLEAVKAVDGVEAVMPVYDTDLVLVSEGEDASSYTTRMHSLPQDTSAESENYLNQLTLVEGRMPEKSGEIVVVLSSTAGAYALERAKNHGVPGFAVPRKELSQADFEAGLLEKLREYRADLILLAGFLSILSEDFVKQWPERIVNVHPALIPSFCGAGYYGLHVHEAALAYGVKVTGATVHFVNEEPDGGPIVLQKAVEIQEGDTPEVLQRRVMEQAEWRILPRAVSLFCEGRLSVESRLVHIKQDKESK